MMRRAALLVGLAAMVVAPVAHATKRGATASGSAHFTLRGEKVVVRVEDRLARRLANRDVSLACGPSVDRPAALVIKRWNGRRHAGRQVMYFPTPVEAATRVCAIGDPSVAGRWYVRARLR